MADKRLNFTVIPAERGWEAISPVIDDDHVVVDLYAHPIIAWQVEAFGNNKGSTFTLAYPVTLQDLNAQPILRDPDGKMFTSGCRMTIPNRAAALTWLQEELTGCLCPEHLAEAKRAKLHLVPANA